MAQQLVLQDYNGTLGEEFTVATLLDDESYDIPRLIQSGLAVIQFNPATMADIRDRYLSYGPQRDQRGWYLSSLLLQEGAFGVPSAPIGPASGDLSGTYPAPLVDNVTTALSQHGSVLFYDSGNTLKSLAPGAPNDVLISNGVNNDPTFGAVPLPANLVQGGVNVGDVSPDGEVFFQKFGTNLQFRRIVAGNNIALDTTLSNAIEISSTSGGGALNTLANVGVGAGQLFRNLSPADTANVRTIDSNASMTVATSGDEIDLSVDLADASLGLVGTGLRVTGLTTSTGVVNTLGTAPLVGQALIAISATAATWQTQPPGSVTMANLGSGAAVLDNPGTGAAFNFRGFLGVNDIAVAQTGLNDVTIDAAGLLPLDGSRPMTGNLDLNGNSLLNTGNAQPSAYLDTGVAVGTRAGLNIIPGTNVTVGVVDNPGQNRVDLTINSSGGGGGEANTLQRIGTATGIDITRAKLGTALQVAGLLGADGLTAATVSDDVVFNISELESAKTANVTTTNVLAPNGAGGVEWRAETGGGSITGAANVGAGADIFRDEVAGVLNFRGVFGANGITSAVNVDNIDVAVQAADASISVGAGGVAVGVLQSDAMHGNLGNGALHADADLSTAGFIPALDLLRVRQGLHVGVFSPGDGELAIGSGPAVFNVAAGEGRIVDFTDPAVPVVTNVMFGGATDVTVTNIATTDTTLVFVNAAGAVVQIAIEDVVELDFRDKLPLGSIIHPNSVNIREVASSPRYAHDGVTDYWQESRLRGAINISGNSYFANGANLQVSKTVGQSRQTGIAFHQDANVPSSKGSNSSAITDLTLGFRTIGSNDILDTNDDQASLVIPGQFDTGAGLSTVAVNDWSIQRFYYSPGADITVLMFGQETFNTFTDADDASGTESFSKPISLGGYIFRFRLIIRGGASDLSDTGDAVFKEALDVGSGGGGGGGGGGGEANDGVNVGAGTGEVFRDKTVVDLNFKTFNGTDGVGIVNNADTIDVTGTLLLPRDGSRAMTGSLDMGVNAISLASSVGIAAATPELRIDASGAGLNERLWAMTSVTAGTFDLGTLDDAAGPGQSAMSITRTGTTVDIINFGNGTLQSGGTGVVLESRLLTAGNGLTGGGDLSANRTFTVQPANGSITVSGSGVTVGVLQNDAMHGNLGGGLTHAVAVAGVSAGYISPANQTKLDDLPATADDTQALNVGGATGQVFRNKTGGDTLNFKTFNPLNGIAIVDGANTIDIDGAAFLQLAGGTMSGNITMAGNDVLGADQYTLSNGNAFALTGLTATSDVRVTGATADFTLAETGATADEGNWRIRADGNQLEIVALSDLFAPGANSVAMRIARSGTTVTSTTIVDGTLSNAGSLVFLTSGGRSMSGALNMNTQNIIGAGSIAATSVTISGTPVVVETRDLIAGAGLTGGGTLAANRTFNVVAADASISVTADAIAVGVLQSDAMHGLRGGGTQHAVAVAGGANGFFLGTDKTKLDAIEALAKNNTLTDMPAITGVSIVGTQLGSALRVRGVLGINGITTAVASNDVTVSISEVENALTVNATTTNVLSPDGAGGVTWRVESGSGAGHVIQDEGTPLAQRTNLNFVGAGVTVTDGGAGPDSSLVTIPSGSFPGADGQLILSDGASGSKVVTDLIFNTPDDFRAPGRLRMLHASNPGIRLDATGGAADEKLWVIDSDTADADALSIRTVTDVLGAGVTAMRFIRGAGTAVSGVDVVTGPLTEEGVDVFLVDGSKPMTNDLNLATFDLLNGGVLNGAQLSVVGSTGAFYATLTGTNTQSQALMRLQGTGTNGADVEVYTGIQDPNAVVTGSKGSLFLRDATPANESNAYTNMDGATIWHPLRRDTNETTGVLQPGSGQITNGTGAAQFTVSAGRGSIVSYADPEHPVVTYVTWSAKTDVTPTLIATTQITFLLIDSAGTLIQVSGTSPTDVQRKSQIFLGLVSHADNATISDIVSAPAIGYMVSQDTRTVIQDLEPIYRSGGDISANGVNLSIDQSSARVFYEGANFFVDPNEPSNFTTAAQTPVIFDRIYGDGTVGGETVIPAEDVTVIDPLNYDNGGTLTAVGGTGDRATIQRVYAGPLGGIAIAYGQEFFTTLTDAVAAAGTEVFVESAAMQISRPIAVICVTTSAVDLSDLVDASIINNTRGGGGGGGGGGGATTFLELTDTPVGFTANRLLKTNAGASALEDSATLSEPATGVMQVGQGSTGGIIVFPGVFDNGDSGAADTITWDNGQTQDSRLTANVTYTFVAPSGASAVRLRIQQDGTGSRTAIFPGGANGVKWAGGTPPTLSTAANAIDFVSFDYRPDTDDYFGMLLGLAFA